VTAVAVDHRVDEGHVVDTLAGLVGKSLVAVGHSKGDAQFRLLDTTRSYAWQKLRVSGEFDETARRHAAYFRKLLERTIDGSPCPDGRFFFNFWPHVANVRSALEWSFSHPSESQIAISLAAASSRLFLEMSLLTECSVWSERAIAVLDESSV